MFKVKTIKINFIMNIILTVSSVIFPLITFPYVSRVLLPLGTGKVSFATSIISYCTMFAQLGIPTYGIRACAKVRDDKILLSKTVHEILIINLILCIFSYVAFAIALINVPRIYDEKALFIITSTTIFFNAIGVEWLYKGLEQYTYITKRSLIMKIISLCFLFLLVKSKEDYIIYAAILALASVGANIFNFLHVKKYIYIKALKNYHFKKHLKPILIFFSMVIATTIYTSLDSVMLGFIRGNEDVGFYSASVSIKSLLVCFITSLGTVLLPRVSYYVERGFEDKFKAVTKKALNFVIVFSSPLSVYFVIMAKEGILFLSGPAYMGAVLPMKILMPTLFLIGMTNISSLQMLVPLGKEKVVLLSNICGAIAALTINLLLISKYGASGAAFGALVAEFIVFSIQFISLRDMIHPIIKSIKTGKILLSLIIASMSLIWTLSVQWNPFITLVISVCCFFSIYLILLYLFKENIVVEIVDKYIIAYIKQLINKVSAASQYE